MDGVFDLLLRDEIPLERRRQYAEAKWFREDQHVSGSGSCVSHDPVYFDEARHGETILGFLVLGGVPAAEPRARFFDLGLAAGQDLTQNPEVQRAGERDQIQSRQGLAAHRVNVREGVRGGDLSEPVRVVYYGREEVGRLQEQAAAERDEPRIIAGLDPAHKAVDRSRLEPSQCLLQVPWSELGGSTSLSRVLRQPYACTLVHRPEYTPALHVVRADSRTESVCSGARLGRGHT